MELEISTQKILHGILVQISFLPQIWLNNVF